MKLEDQVVSLELAKRLKELGVRQESYFVWSNGHMGQGEIKTGEYYVSEVDDYIVTLDSHKDMVDGLQIYSAFTVAELGEMLPEYSGTLKREHDYVCMFKDIVINKTKNEANARAKMLIHLLENKLMNLEAK